MGYVTFDLPPAVGTALDIALIALVAVVAYLFLRHAVRLALSHLLAREVGDGMAPDLAEAEIAKRSRTVEFLAMRTGTLLIVIVATLMILSTLGINIGPAVAGLGVAGLAIGLGTQTLVRDWVAGTLIVLENQFSRGDVIEVAGVTGTVEHISLRRTVLRGTDGTVHSVPNGEIRVASNQTKFWSGVSIDVELTATDRLDDATRTIDRIGLEMKADPELGPLIVDPPHVDRITKIGAGGVTLLVLGSVRAKEQWRVGGELRRRILAEFGREGISL